MNYTLQLHGERMLYPVPPGLYDLISDISREVLRDQPTMLYDYIAHYLETLVKVREYSRIADHLVDGVTQDNHELLTYVESLGMSWDHANQAARKIQRAFRMFRAKFDIKREVQTRLRELSLSNSFCEYLEAHDLDQEKARTASEIIQNAFRTYQSKKILEEKRLSKDASTHTIETIHSKLLSKEKIGLLLKKKKPSVRDSKLMVYQQSPKESVVSTWSALARDLAEKDAKQKTCIAESSFDPSFVYEQTDDMMWTYKKKETPVSDCSIVPEDRISLPSYYDEYQPKIPMISESGLLVTDEPADIVTLFSSDSLDEDQKSKLKSIVTLPTLSHPNLTPTSKPEDLAKELFEVIGTRSLSASKSRTPKSQSKQSNEEFQKVREGSTTMVKERSINSNPRTISVGGVSAKKVSMVGMSPSKKSEQLIKIDFDTENIEENPTPP